jgi:hypothetical protein
MDANIKMHRKEMSRKIKNLRSNNSKEHWNILRQGTNKKQPNISIDSLFEFFLEILIKLQRQIMKMELTCQILVTIL